jgi:competence protein ComEA
MSIRLPLKLSRDESRAVAFIGLLLALSAGVRLVDRPAAIEVEGPAVDLAELEAAGRRKLEGRAPAEASARPLTGPARVEGRSSRATGAAGGPQPLPAPPQPVDVNRATVQELERLPGIGNVLARRIIAYRDSVGGFRSVDQLVAVRGIGPAMIRRLTPLIRVGS